MVCVTIECRGVYTVELSRDCEHSSTKAQNNALPGLWNRWKPKGWHRENTSPCFIFLCNLELRRPFPHRFLLNKSCLSSPTWRSSISWPECSLCKVWSFYKYSSSALPKELHQKVLLWFSDDRTPSKMDSLCCIEVGLYDIHYNGSLHTEQHSENNKE